MTQTNLCVYLIRKDTQLTEVGTEDTSATRPVVQLMIRFNSDAKPYQSQTSYPYI